MQSTFIYEDLVFRAKKHRYQIKEISQFLDNKWNNNKTTRDQFESSSFTFIDPYGALIVDRYMSHKTIALVLQKCVKDYVPQHLQKTVKIGKIDSDGDIALLNDNELQQNLSKYGDSKRFVAYCEVPVWMFNEFSVANLFRLRFLLTDTMTKVRTKIESCQKWNDMELRLFKSNNYPNKSPESWNRSVPLKAEDTIMSCHFVKVNFVSLFDSFCHQ